MTINTVTIVWVEQLSKDLFFSIRLICLRLGHRFIRPINAVNLSFRVLVLLFRNQFCTIHRLVTTVTLLINSVVGIGKCLQGKDRWPFYGTLYIEAADYGHHPSVQYVRYTTWYIRYTMYVFKSQSFLDAFQRGSLNFSSFPFLQFFWFFTKEKGETYQPIGFILDSISSYNSFPRGSPLLNHKPGLKTHHNTRSLGLTSYGSRNGIPLMQEDGVDSIQHRGFPRDNLQYAPLSQQSR